MSFAPQFQTPGGWAFDTPATAGQPLHANIFRPPSSPAASSYNLAKSTGSLLSDMSIDAAQHMGAAKRKRANMGDSTSLDWHMNMDGANDGREEERSREFRYTLAGQICTPAAPPVGVENGLLEESVYSDVDYRRALGPKFDPEAESPPSGMRTNQAMATPALTAWSLLSLQTIGQVVGKVWEFCKKGAFRGFQAGGGQGYTVNGTTVTETSGEQWAPELETPQMETPFVTPTEYTPMRQDPPAYFPDQAPPPYASACADISTPEPTPRPAVKRRQVSANHDELRTWVVVDEPSDQQPMRFTSEVKKAAAARPSGLARPRSGYYSQASASSHRRITAPSQRLTGGTPTLPRAATRPPLRLSNVGSPSTIPREPASFASPRASPASRAATSRIPVAIPSPIQQSHNPNPFAIPAPTTTTIPTLIPSPTTASPTLKTTASRPSSRHSHPPTRSHGHASRQSLGGGSIPTPKPLRPTSPSKYPATHRRNRSSTSSLITTTPTSGLNHISKTRRQSLLPKRPVTAGAAGTEDKDSQFPKSPLSPRTRLDAEARQLAQRKLAAERDADAKVDLFNARLLSMIRQGREALGTRVEVEMDLGEDFGEEDGFDDGGYGGEGAFGDAGGMMEYAGGGGTRTGTGWEDDD